MTEVGKLCATPNGMRLYQQERTILEATELVCEALEKTGVSRAELARRLGKTRAFVTQVLDGDKSNMTMRTISDILHALGFELRMDFTKMRVPD